jgi:hypothetical protein
MFFITPRALPPFLPREKFATAAFDLFWAEACSRIDLLICDSEPQPASVRPPPLQTVPNESVPDRVPI